MQSMTSYASAIRCLRSNAVSSSGNTVSFSVMIYSSFDITQKSPQSRPTKTSNLSRKMNVSPLQNINMVYIGIEVSGTSNPTSEDCSKAINIKALTLEACLHDHLTASNWPWWSLPFGCTDDLSAFPTPYSHTVPLYSPQPTLPPPRIKQ